MDLSLFSSADTWISLITLVFLEIVLGIDNIVFISLTSSRLPLEKQHLGRKLGLAGALLMRCLFLVFASWLVNMTDAIFTVDLGFYSHGFSIRDIVLITGGLYLIYKGAAELASVLSLRDLNASADSSFEDGGGRISLFQAVATIMIMDIVFSIDSVITAVGLAQHLVIMILAVFIAIFVMMAFIDLLSDFIENHIEMKILALFFIAAIGILLILDACHITSDIEVFDMHLEKLMVYFAMIFSVILQCIQMRYATKLAKLKTEREREHEA